jgi:hypothetical protein
VRVAHLSNGPGRIDSCAPTLDFGASPPIREPKKNRCKTQSVDYSPSNG